MKKKATSRLRLFRSRQGLTQAELARCSGISRSGIAAIENGALIPSVKAAMALARVLSCTVEELFAAERENEAVWAWRPSGASGAYWLATLGQRTLCMPVEPIPFELQPFDGWFDGCTLEPHPSYDPDLTLILASCDPAMGLLSGIMREKTNIRLLTYHRHSRDSLSLLKEGVIHVAGIHLREIEEGEGNAVVVSETLGKGYRLLRGSVWHEGVAVRPNEQLTALGRVATPRIRWIGRKEGSGARRCQDKVLENLQSPDQTAADHWEVATAVRHGWVDAGVCHRLVAEQAGLDFLHVSKEAFDFCYPIQLGDDPRLKAFKEVIRSQQYRKCLEHLRGYEVSATGEEETI